MRRTGLSWVAMAAVALALSGCSRASETERPASEEPGARPGAVGGGGAGANLKDDGDFVRDVATKNMAEIEFSRLALDRATRADIKAFAQMMIADHGSAGEKLKAIVSDQPVDWPAQLDDKSRDTAGELAKEQGADFDREYLKAMVESHQNLTAKLESRLDVQSLAAWKTAAAGRTQSQALPQPDVELRDVAVRPDMSEHVVTMKINQWAAETYPVAQKHLDSARMLESATKNGLGSEGIGR